MADSPWTSGGFHGPPPYYGGDGSGSGGSSAGGFAGPGSGGSAPFGSFGPGFNVDQATRLRTIHGALLAAAFVGLFPLGAVFVRVLPGRAALWLHVLSQTVGFALAVAGVALGLWMIANVKPFGSSLFSISSVSYHPIIGLVVFALLLIQPLLGIVHHLRFRQVHRRQVWSYLHLWNGRLALIPLGIINGGLGLHVSGASLPAKIAYAVVAGVMGLVWLLAACFGEARRARAARREGRRHGGAVSKGDGAEVTTAESAGRRGSGARHGGRSWGYK